MGEIVHQLEGDLKPTRHQHFFDENRDRLQHQQLTNSNAQTHFRRDTLVDFFSRHVQGIGGGKGKVPHHFHVVVGGQRVGLYRVDSGGFRPQSELVKGKLVDTEPRSLTVQNLVGLEHHHLRKRRHVDHPELV